jgi:hypothetical protein
MRLAENKRSEWPKGHYRFEALVELSRVRSMWGCIVKRYICEKRSAAELVSCIEAQISKAQRIEIY